MAVIELEKGDSTLDDTPTVQIELPTPVPAGGVVSVFCNGALVGTASMVDDLHYEFVHNTPVPGALVYTARVTGVPGADPGEISDTFNILLQTPPAPVITGVYGAEPSIDVGVTLSVVQGDGRQVSWTVEIANASVEAVVNWPVTVTRSAAYAENVSNIPALVSIPPLTTVTFTSSGVFNAGQDSGSLEVSVLPPVGVTDPEVTNNTDLLEFTLEPPISPTFNVFGFASIQAPSGYGTFSMEVYCNSNVTTPKRLRLNAIHQAGDPSQSVGIDRIWSRLLGSEITSYEYWEDNVLMEQHAFDPYDIGEDSVRAQWLSNRLFPNMVPPLNAAVIVNLGREGSFSLVTVFDDPITNGNFNATWRFKPETVTPLNVLVYSTTLDVVVNEEVAG